MRSKNLICNKRKSIICLFVILTSINLNAQEGGQLNIEELTIQEMQNLMQAGQVTSEQLVKTYLQRIKELDGKLNAIIELNPEALQVARAMDKERENGKVRSLMHGIPFVIKDNIETADKMHTTAGSFALLEMNKPKKDAFIISQLRASGAILLAKTNLSEWANFRSTNSSSGWSGRGGQTHNPYILDRSPCGSSSGSGVAVSANLTAVAIGTETDGSIVCPASLNGIVGIKPTLGLLSRSGIIPLAHSQDTADPMARTVTDAAIMLQEMVARDRNDLISLTKNKTINFEIDYTKSLVKNGLKGMKIGVAKQYFGESQAIAEVMNKSLATMKANGAILIDVELPEYKNYGDAEYEVLLYEFKSDLNIYLADRGGKYDSLEKLIQFNRDNSDKQMPYFKQEIFEEAQLKTELDKKSYLKALSKSKEVTRRKGIDVIMDKHNLDAIVAPSNMPAWTIDLIYGDSPNNYISSSSLAAVSGYPNITVPAGFIKKMPIGISFFGRAYSESTLIKIAYAWEQVSKARKKPEMLETYH